MNKYHIPSPKTWLEKKKLTPLCNVFLSKGDIRFSLGIQPLQMCPETSGISQQVMQ